MARPRHINIVSVTIYLLIVAFGYVTLKFGPVYWKNQDLRSLVGNHAFAARRKGPVEVKRDLIRDAERRLGITLEEDDVEVEKQSDYVYIYVYWETEVEHPWGKPTNLSFEIEKESNL